MSEPGQFPSTSQPTTSKQVAEETEAGSIGRSGNSKDNGSQDRARIVAFGDSLTSGLGVPQEDAYPAQLQRKLDQTGFQVRVINAGVSGETSAGGLRRVGWVLKGRPDLVILELGGNDGLRGIDPDETQANLDRIIRRLRSAGIPVVLAGMKLPPNYGEEFTSRFAAIFPELAGTYNLPFLPFFLEGVAMQKGLIQADGIHPTADGYRVIVENLMPVVEPLIREMRSKESGTPQREGRKRQVRGKHLARMGPDPHIRAGA